MDLHALKLQLIEASDWPSVSNSPDMPEFRIVQLVIVLWLGNLFRTSHWNWTMWLGAVVTVERMLVHG